MRFFGKQSLSFQQLMKPDQEKCELRPKGKGNLFLPSPPPSSPAWMAPFLPSPSASLTSWENICADGQGERLENGLFTVNLKYAGNAFHQEVYASPLAGSTYREAVLGDRDAAGLHGDAHALADAACKSVQLVRSFAAVPRGAPATHEHTSEPRKHLGKMSNSTRCYS